MPTVKYSTAQLLAYHRACSVEELAHIYAPDGMNLATNGALSVVSAQQASWLPTDVSGLVGWWDASDTDTLTTDVDGYVSQWDDKGPNGVDLTEGTGTAQPRSGTRTIGGVNALYFDGGDQLSNTTTFDLSGTNTCTMFAVVEVDSTPAQGIICTSWAAGLDYNDPVAIRFMQVYDASDFATFYNNGSSLATMSLNPRLLTMYRNGAAGAISANGTFGTGFSGSGTTNFAATKIRVGNGIFGSALYGTIGELFLYDQYYSSTSDEYVAAEQYLYDKFGFSY